MHTNMNPEPAPLTSESDLWDLEECIGDYPEFADLEIPPFLDADISPSEVAAIVQGGCDSGAYMSAVTYYTAKRTMAEHGDVVLDWLESYTPTEFDVSEHSWGSLCVAILSRAVEVWADGIHTDMLDILEDCPEPEPEDETDA